MHSFHSIKLNKWMEIKMNKQNWEETVEQKCEFSMFIWWNSCWDYCANSVSVDQCVLLCVFVDVPLIDIRMLCGSFGVFNCLYNLQKCVGVYNKKTIGQLNQWIESGIVSFIDISSFVQLSKIKRNIWNRFKEISEKLSPPKNKNLKSNQNLDDFFSYRMSRVHLVAYGNSDFCLVFVYAR